MVLLGTGFRIELLSMRAPIRGPLRLIKRRRGRVPDRMNLRRRIGLERFANRLLRLRKDGMA